MSAVPLTKVCEIISAAFTGATAALLVSEVSARHSPLSNHSGEVTGRNNTHEAADERQNQVNQSVIVFVFPLFPHLLQQRIVIIPHNHALGQRLVTIINVTIF